MLAVFWCKLFFLFFFFLQKFNSNKWCYLFRLKIFASCCVCFCVAMQCNCFHFYRFFLLCFDTNLQINFTQFSGKICIDITQISVLMFFFISVKMSKKDFFFSNMHFKKCLDLFIIVLIFKVIDIVEFFPSMILWYWRILVQIHSCRFISANELILTELSVCQIVSLYAREVHVKTFLLYFCVCTLYSFSTALINKKW